MERSKVNRWFALSADIATVVIAVVVLVLVVQRYVAPSLPMNPMASALLNINVNNIFGVDFAAKPRTAVVIVQQDCPACTQSLPFYRRLTENRIEAAQIVFAAPSEDEGIGAYLAMQDVNPDSIVLMARPEQLLFSATPTILITGRDGVVTHAWIGVLSSDAEAEVFQALFGAV